MTTIPERIRDEARLVCNGFFTAHRDLYVDDVAQALLAAEKRGREEAAKEFIERQNERNRRLSETLHNLQRSTN